MEAVENRTYNISKHCKERYAERILGKNSTNEIRTYLLEHGDQVEDNISKMITYGKLIYSGKQKREQKVSIIHVYVKDCWILLLDPSNNTVITLYKADLGLDEDFSQEYVSRMLKKISEASDALERVKKEVTEESDMYRKMMEDNNEQITEYRKYIKNLENLNEAYEEIINNNIVKTSLAERELADIVNKLIGKREF